MKILVISDSHGAENTFIDVLEKQKDADALFFLGDGERDFDAARYYMGKMRIYAVKGNCDMFSSLNDEDLEILDGKRIFYTHGHKFSVKSGYDYILAKGKSLSADIVLFGHTHIPLSEERENVLLFNPGSLNNGSYGIIEIKNGKIETKIRRR
jgi:putative phosphoesterase